MIPKAELNMKAEKMMKHNNIKIKSDPQNHTLAFYILSEQQKWCPVSNSSVLSRKKIAGASIKDVAAEIIGIIDSVYNMHNRGVDIYFEGTEDDFAALQDTVGNSFADKNIKCILQQTIIVVAGKVQSGKTTLIEELARYRGDDYQVNNVDSVFTYASNDNAIIFYEIPGIDIGVDNIIAVRETFERLVKTGVTVFLYCLSSSKIEYSEENLIKFVAQNYPSIKVIVALTKYIDEDSASYPKQLSKRLNGIEVVPLLAKKIKVRQGAIDAYGIDALNRELFEEK